MVHLVFTVVLTLAVIFIAAYNAKPTGVCYNQQASYRIISTVAYRQGTQSYTTSHSCGIFNWKRCRRTYYRAHQESFLTYQRVETYSTVSQCCTGYVGTPPSCQAQCAGGCQNGGTCISPGVCECAPRWTGTNCERDVNECNGDHLCDHHCINTNGSYVCSCIPGYELESDNRTCQDINECLAGNGGCAQMCNNIAGSFECSCEHGYELTSDHRTCIDIRECQTGAHNCSQLCVELEGRYKCRCIDGYELADDQVTCEDIDECAQGTSRCSQGCRNTPGDYICTCNEGYQMHHEDPAFCIDIDECVKSNGGCQHDCNNNIGSYQCWCHIGYVLSTDQHSCEDINECSVSNGGCQHNCTNTIGSHYCSCAAGCTLDDDNDHSCKCTHVEGSDDDTGHSVASVTPVLSDGDPKDDRDSSNTKVLSVVGIIVFIAVVMMPITLVTIFAVRYLLKKYRQEEPPFNTNNRLCNIIENPSATNNFAESDCNHRTIERKSVNMNNRSHNNICDNSDNVDESDYNHRSLELNS